jgi:hypothetical protein
MSAERNLHTARTSPLSFHADRIEQTLLPRDARNAQCLSPMTNIQYASLPLTQPILERSHHSDKTRYAIAADDQVTSRQPAYPDTMLMATNWNAKTRLYMLNAKSWPFVMQKRAPRTLQQSRR